MAVGAGSFPNELPQTKTYCTQVTVDILNKNIHQISFYHEQELN